MRDKHCPWLLTGLWLAALASGCQTFRHDSASHGSGPSRSFGLDYVPRQSEPPIESTGAGAKAGSRSSKDSQKVTTASIEESADEDSPRKSNALARLLPVREKDPPQSKPLPVASRSSSATESTGESTAGIWDEDSK